VRVSGLSTQISGTPAARKSSIFSSSSVAVSFGEITSTTRSGATLPCPSAGPSGGGDPGA
jgi:hypothetical protein